MITHIWLKKQPNKKLSYPNYYPLVYFEVTVEANSKQIYKVEAYNFETNKTESVYLMSEVSRVEFRP